MKIIKFEDKSFQVSDESYEAFRKQFEKKESRFVPEKGEDFYSVNIGMNILVVARRRWTGSEADYYSLNSGNCFKTIEEAEKHRDKLLATAEVTRYCHEKDYVLDCDWKDMKQEKYMIMYDRRYKKFEAGFSYSTQQHISLPSLKSEEACDDVINTKKAELSLIFEIE